MRVLVAGATGYVGGRLVPRLVDAGHDVHALARDPSRLEGRPWSDGVTAHQADLLDPESVAGLPAVDAAFYLVHAMGQGRDFERKDRLAATHFGAVRTRHCIYLGGLQPAGRPRPHLQSRAEVGRILSACLPTTELRAGPIIGSGSASFEIVRHLTERLPAMVAPKWIDNRVRPVAIATVLDYLEAALARSPAGIVAIGGPALTFRQMMQGYAAVRGLRRRAIVALPVLAPRVAARWVQWVTPVPNRLAVPIIDGIREDLVADIGRARRLYPHVEPIAYDEAVRRALARTDADAVETRWSGAATHDATRAPAYERGSERNLLHETRSLHVAAPPARVFAVLGSLGGERGWLAWPWAWRLRGVMDRALGGPGLQRGRRSRSELRPGDVVDFWRVESVRPPGLLRLRAEMRLPGKAWLQYEVAAEGAGSRMAQTALFQPRGLPGILYWTTLAPVHRMLFRRLARAIAREAEAA